MFKVSKIFLIIATITLMAICDVSAAMRLSVLPVNGGSTLRLGRVAGNRQINKEVRVRISNSDGKQYQVFQRMIDPLRNERNQSLDFNAVKTYSIAGSNSNGTLYANSPQMFNQTGQLVYSSASSGESDSFTLVYALDNQWVKSNGQYFGRILYTIRPFGGGTQERVFLNVTLDVSGDLKISVEGSSNRNSIRLDFKGRHQSKGYAKISFEGNFSDQIRIYQEIDSYIQDKELDELDRGVVGFVTSGQTKGQLHQQTLSDLVPRRVLLYSSTAQEDEFLVNYLTSDDKILTQKAGQFFGKIKYIIEVNGKERFEVLDLEVVLDPVFNLDVKFPQGGVNFANLLPDSPPIIKEVLVNVTSNLKRPYMITQSVVSPLTNQKGDQIASQNFTMKGLFVETQKGKLIAESFEFVIVGDAPIFISDSKGSSAAFKIIYRLRSNKEILAGDYTTAIRFSLGEM